jgi:hypothetical protein
VFGSSSQNIQEPYFAPFMNASVFRLMNWFYSGSNLKSHGELDRLVTDVILANDFKAEDFVGFRSAREARRLDDENHQPQSHFSAGDGWVETAVNISLPADGIRYSSEEAAPQFAVPGLFYRPLLEVIRAALHDAAAEHFHIFPFQTFWKPSPDATPERVYAELYTSDAFIMEHEKLHAQLREPGCDLETVIVAIMLWSDSTHLASFGTASLWPIYLYIGNQSKYTRGKPTSFSAHHLAYIPKVRSPSCLLQCITKLPFKLVDTIQDFYREKTGKPATASVLRHLRRELMQAIWLLLLDDKLIDAYLHGTVVECSDGTSRRFFPRFFTYSCDYPEKYVVFQAACTTL